MKQSCLTMEKRHRMWFWAGLFAVLLTLLPCMLLGEDAVFTYYDQLDGELIAYILQARHLFSGDMLPEFMGGVSKTALTLPAPLAVFSFLGSDAYTGLVILLSAGRLAGYIGMYLLCRDTVREPWIAATAGILYSLIPFLPVYGLSEFGIPLLLRCVLQLRKKRHAVWAFLYIALFTLSSSLVLVGFGLLGMWGIMLIIWALRKERGTSLALPASAWLMMLVLYIAENFSLFRQLTGGGEPSHKAEYALSPNAFFGTFFESLMQGGQHSRDEHVWLLLLAAAAAAVCLLRAKAGKRALSGTYRAALLRSMGVCLGWNCLFALTAGLWKSAAGIRLRSLLGVFGAFQVERVLWIAPCLWYLLGACGIALIWQYIREHGRSFFCVCAGLPVLLAVCVTGVRLLQANDVKANIQKLRNPDYAMLSLRDYYAMGVMEQVEEFLYDRTGQTQAAYRVVSLGIDPAAALYHGFYCLDGYSNNYPLAYKHAFRRIIEPELEKSDYLKEYFDGWGNRCYLFSSECPGYFTIEKNGFYFQNYQLNSEALRELGGKYLFSAAYIVNAEEQGLTLMREEPFETSDSYYRIFVYAVDL